MRFTRTTRDPDHIILCAVSACFGIGLLVLGSRIWAIFPFALSMLFLWGCVRRRVATLDIDPEGIKWDFRQFKKTTGEVVASEIQSIVVNDCGCTLEITLKSGEMAKVPYVSIGADIQKALIIAFPLISVRYESGT